MINNLISNSLSDLGYSGALDDMLAEFYKDNGATSKTYWLISQVGTSGALNDLKYAYLMSKGLSGTLNDMFMESIRDNSYFTQPTGLGVLTTGSWEDAGLWDDSNTWNDGI